MSDRILMSRYHAYVKGEHYADFVIPFSYGPTLAEGYWEVRVENALECSLQENGIPGAVVILGRHFQGCLSDNLYEGVETFVLAELADDEPTPERTVDRSALH